MAGIKYLLDTNMKQSGGGRTCNITKIYTALDGGQRKWWWTSKYSYYFNTADSLNFGRKGEEVLFFYSET